VIRLDASSQRINSALATADRFRNINGVYMKLMNFGAYLSSCGEEVGEARALPRQRGTR